MSTEKAKIYLKKKSIIFYVFHRTIFYEEDPQYFYEMYENLEHKGIMVDNNQLYLMQKSSIYKLPTD